MGCSAVHDALALGVRFLKGVEAKQLGRLPVTVGLISGP